MLTGKKFKLESSTLALTIIDGKQKAVTVPLGTEIKVISVPTNDQDQMVEVLWDEKTVLMFAVDVDVRGTEIQEPVSRS